jgi:predicted nucleotidyltransferase component of viral defense system
MISEQSLKDKLQTISKEQGVPFNACWKELLLERFLSRLASSNHANKFIFKGGFLLSYLIEIGRETMDLDFLLTRLTVEEETLRILFNEITSSPSFDNFIFSLHSISLLTQPHMQYPGYRVTFNAIFGKMKDKIQVDIGIGDTVAPLTYELPLTKYRGKPFFETSISLLIYPPESIFAEKFETILSKGTSNSRMKDYHDLVLLIRNQSLLHPEKLQITLSQTFSHRGTELGLIKFDETGIGTLQRLWAAHLNGLGDYAELLQLPAKISDVIESINYYVTSLLEAPAQK